MLIDLPQAVNAPGNNGGVATLEPYVNNIRDTLGRFAAELPESEFAREICAPSSKATDLRTAAA